MEKQEDGWNERRPDWYSMNAKRVCVAIAFLVGFLNFAGCSTNHFLNGVKLLGEVKDYDGAIVEFTRAIDANPNYEGPYWGRGTAYNIKGDYDRAIADYTRAIELNPKYATAYYYRGDTWYKKADDDLAIKDYTKAIALDPTNFHAYNGRGNAWKNKGEYEPAIRDYNKAVELRPRSPFAYGNRGNILYFQGKFGEAIPDYLKAIENNYKPSDYLYLRLLLASSRVSEEDYEKFRKEFSDYVASQKVDEWIREISNYYLRGHKGELQIIEQAQRSGKSQKEIRERLCEAYYYLGEYRLMKGDRNGAGEFFRKSIETNIYHFTEHHSSRAMLRLMMEGKI